MATSRTPSSEFLIEPQPGSLIAEALNTSQGIGSHESLTAFVAHCMNNGDINASLPRCLLKSIVSGPEIVELSSVRRTVGVGPHTEIKEDYESFYGNVERIEHRIKKGEQPGPFIIEPRSDSWSYLLDGNHTKMALKRLAFPCWWAITLTPIESPLHTKHIEAQAA